MEVLPEQPKLPDVSAEQHASDDLIKLIRKLRWMGMLEEAERVEMQLMLRRARPTDSVVATPQETD